MNGKNTGLTTDRTQELRDFSLITGLRVRFIRLLMRMNERDFGQTLGINHLQFYAMDKGDYNFNGDFFVTLNQQYGVSLNWIVGGYGNIFDRKGPLTPLHIYLPGCYKGAGLELTDIEFPTSQGIKIEIKHLMVTPSPEIFDAYILTSRNHDFHIIVFGEENELLFYSAFKSLNEALESFNNNYNSSNDPYEFSDWYTPDEQKLVNVLIDTASGLSIDARHVWTSVSDGE